MRIQHFIPTVDYNVKPSFIVDRETLHHRMARGNQCMLVLQTRRHPVGSPALTVPRHNCYPARIVSADEQAATDAFFDPASSMVHDPLFEVYRTACAVHDEVL